ncbi:SusC/RagA family TonB-linked outer membrane protein [Carboxylicivirga sp. N1Y90]|uniref:SusC/RagA family TonB-linked outer membrane protein n=1 Tax=Carboxylicivirga fragile TaxID=3417571 RepID=UPI003D331047|nr:TonB-dependent receptor [Marinilabiliaceae bacterium N1Y90]
MKKNRTGFSLKQKLLPPNLIRRIRAFLLMFIVCSSMFAQQARTVTGEVLDATGATLPGVSVILKGTSEGTITDLDGKFMLSVPAEINSLVFSFIGMMTQEIDVSNQTIISVVLKDDVQGLEEVVVVGYGTQKKVNLTGGVDVVSAKDLENRPVANVAQAIQGVAPSLNISTTDAGGEPGAGSSWNIRGVGSINGNDSPYILVDGVPMDIQNLNPDDIESISILKDAAASAIYGARAPYGVVLITTKKGKKGTKPSVTYSNNFAWAAPTNLPKGANSMDAALAMNKAAENSGLGPVIDDETLGRIQAYLDGSMTDETIPDPADPTSWGTWTKGNANNDWMDIYYKDWSARQKHDISLSGAGDKVSYYTSAGFYSQDGQLDFGNDNYSRYNMSARIDAQVTDWFNFGVNTKYTRTKNVWPNAWGGYNRDIIHHQFSRNWPMNPLYLPNGERSSDNNIQLIDESGDRERFSDDFWVTFSGELEPIEGWKTRVNYSWNNSSYKQKSHLATTYGTNVVGETYTTFNNPNSFEASFQSDDYHMLNVVSSYFKEINEHTFNVLVGYEEELKEYSRGNLKRAELVTDKVPSISTATGQLTGGDQWTHWATQGVFGRFTYNFKEKYLVEFNARYDGSSLFGNADTQWGFFPSGSIGYNISKEDFWEPIELYVNSLKFRGSYGSLGNHDYSKGTVGDYFRYYETLPVSTNLPWIVAGERPVYTGAPGLISPALTWETSTTLNIGLDAAFLNHRLGLNFDWYKRTTSDMIGPSQSLPDVLGASPPLINNATLETKGFELVLTWKDRIGNLSYNVRGVLGDNKTVISDYSNPTKTLNNWYSGQEHGEIWGYETAGFFKEGETGDDWHDQTAFHSRWQGGDIKFQDLNGDGVINWGDDTVDNPGDKKVIGNTTPRLNYGLSIGLNYKGFDFNMFWQGVAKRDWIFSRYTNVFYGFRGSMWQNSYFEDHMDYWTPENTDAYYPRPYLQGEHLKNTREQTKYLQNAAYLRLKNIQLGYTLRGNWTSKVKLSKVRLYVSGENLLTFTKLSKLFDPEALGGRYGSGKIYPLSKVVSMGVNVTF